MRPPRPAPAYHPHEPAELAAVSPIDGPAVVGDGDRASERQLAADDGRAFDTSCAPAPERARALARLREPAGVAVRTGAAAHHRSCVAAQLRSSGARA